MELPSVEQGEPVNQIVATNDFVVTALEEDNVQDDDQVNFVDRP